MCTGNMPQDDSLTELMRTIIIFFLEICRSAALAVPNCKVWLNTDPDSESNDSNLTNSYDLSQSRPIICRI